METRESSDQHWRFGIFEVDSRRSELRRGGTPVKLREQSFRILVLLLERAGEIVTREELRQGLWPSDTYVDFEHSLNTAIMKLRNALGDSADKPLYIETIPKRGYRFIAPITVPPIGQSAIPSSHGENAIATPERPTRDESEIADLSKGLPPERVKERHRYLLLGIAMSSVVVIALCVLAVARQWQSPAPHERGQSSGAAPGMRSVAVVSVPGRLRDPALSPDAKAIAYVWDGDNPERGDVYVQLVGGEKPLRLTHTSSGFICCTSWSPDGRQIAFGLCDDSGGSVMSVAALGGPPRKLIDAPCLYGEGGWPVWMADGKSLIVVGSCKPGGPRGLVLLPLSTGEKRCLTAPPAGMGDWRPALSPNQKTLAFLRMPASNASVGDIYALSLSDGEVRQVTAERHSIWGMMWAADGQHIVFSSSRGGLAAMWTVKATGGPIERETLYRKWARCRATAAGSSMSAIWEAGPLPSRRQTCRHRAGECLA